MSDSATSVIGSGAFACPRCWVYFQSQSSPCPATAANASAAAGDVTSWLATSGRPEALPAFIVSAIRRTHSCTGGGSRPGLGPTRELELQVLPPGLRLVAFRQSGWVEMGCSGTQDGDEKACWTSS